MGSVKQLIKFKENATGHDGEDILSGQWTLFEKASVPVEFGPFESWGQVYVVSGQFSKVRL